MTRTIYSYRFDNRIAMSDIEDALSLAVIAAESLHSRVEFRMEAYMRLDVKAHRCIIDAESPIGLDIARIFTGYLIALFGDTAFEVILGEEQRRYETFVCPICALLRVMR